MGLSKDKFRYFSHDADMRNDIKIKALRRKFGNTGYAVWCFLLETLTDREDLEIEYNTVVIELLAADFEITADELQSIIQYCVKINLLQLEADRLYSDRHKERLNEAMSMREKKSMAGKIGMQKRWAEKISENNNDITEKGTVISCDNNKNREERNREEKKNIYPYQDIAELWNSTCSRLPKIQKLTDGRKQKIKCRIDEFGHTIEESMATYKALLAKVAQSDFLNGANNSEWTATFDWLFDNSKNWVKVSEGNYDNKRGAKSAPVAGENNLGAGEYIDGDGTRTYGTGKAKIPLSAPPRPSDSYTWDCATQKWIML